MTDTLQSSSNQPATGRALVADSVSSSRWNFINGWQVVPQSGDRPPALGIAAGHNTPPSVRRSTARRKHQLRFKEWSQARHD